MAAKKKSLPKPTSTQTLPPRSLIGRARNPDHSGYVVRDGVKLFYEVFGSGPITVLLLPTWSVVHSRIWKGMAPYLSRRYRVITFDGRGNGLSDRPVGPEAYAEEQFADDCLAIMDALDAPEVVTVSVSAGARWNLILAANHPQRIKGAIFISPAIPIVAELPERAAFAFTGTYDTDEGWAKFNRRYWKDHYAEFLQWFHEQGQSENHSTKQIEDCVAWGLETTPETLTDTILGLHFNAEIVHALAAKVTCPVLVIHGDADKVRPFAQGAALAEATRGALFRAEGCGHGVLGRQPVMINLLVREFLEGKVPRPPVHTVKTWARSMNRSKRALFISSPIGLGHSRRDVAIADQLRKLHPDLQIDWLAQHPVTTVLEPLGERIVPESSELSSECAHFESMSLDHCQPAFPILRNMDEIMVANYMVFHELMEKNHYDLVVGDEAWEVDHFWHEHPELKIAPFVWLTDLVGYLPTVLDGDDPAKAEREIMLTTDYNAEMIERIDRFRRVRDRAIYIGEAEDIPNASFGAGLPSIPDWTNQHFDFSGYILGFDPATVADKEAIRAELGYAKHEKVCIAAVGGMATGEALLRKCIAAFPEAKKQIPELRLIIVAGPRIDPARLPQVPGLEIRGFVRNLYRHMAVSDLAIVHGGLTQTMDLTAANVPFLFIPYLRQYEQNMWVRHRLDRYGAGRYMDYATTTPSVLAKAMVEEMGRPHRRYRAVGDGSARAAAMIAQLL
ncbi:MAG: alpha/beta fold hydrolase [Kofleriaceae bacterium]